jgi:energy-converting hydrogenase B subunit Q
MDRRALKVIAEDRPGLLRDLSARIADAGGNLTWVSVTVHSGEARLLLEIDGPVPSLADLGEVEEVASAAAVWGKRVIVVGGGAQVAQVAMGAISEADRHNLRGERISVDTIALVGEQGIAEAVRAVARLPRAEVLVLAGSIMGGEITRAVLDLRAAGVPVISLNMVGSVPEAADLVVSDPVQAGVMAVMAIADTAKFELARVRGRRY